MYLRKEVIIFGVKCLSISAILPVTFINLDGNAMDMSRLIISVEVCFL